jgi:hypothetical protein
LDWVNSFSTARADALPWRAFPGFPGGVAFLPGLVDRVRLTPFGFAPGKTSEFSSKNRLTKVIAFISESTGPLPKMGLMRGVV